MKNDSYFLLIYVLINNIKFLFQGFGLKGLNKGMFTTMLRNGSFNAVYFGFYHSVKEIIPERKVLKAASYLSLLIILKIFP